jgi:hypothetical protein
LATKANNILIVVDLAICDKVSKKFKLSTLLNPFATDLALHLSIYRTI